jgi:putative ABC transport system permease protein
VAVILILAISLGLGLSMLLANQAVKDRLQTVKSEVGTTVLVNPAGARGFLGGGEPLSTDDIAKIDGLANIESVDMVLNLTMTTAGSEKMNVHVSGGGLKIGETNLESSADPGTLGKRFGARDTFEVHIQGEAPADLKLPIRLAGISGDRNEEGKTISLTDGRQLKSGDANVAVVGKALAEKNSLKVDSTFTAYGETFTVVGIFDSGTEFGNDSLYIPLATAQRLAGSGKEISNAVVKVDSVDNIESAVAAISKAIGTDKADVTTTEENALTAVESLRTVERVSMIGFVIALAAAAVIIFLTMLMIVRERRREIGVLKAIGGGNRSIVTQFVVEALVLVLVASAVGFGFATLSGNGIAGALVKSNTSSSDSSNSGPVLGPHAFHAIKFRADEGQKSADDYVGDVATAVSLNTLGIGLAAAVVIAIVGSAVPAYLISKVRPAEVLRGE